MGREIRRVPPDWEHPMYMHQYLGHPMQMVPHPLFDEVYEDALAEWEAGKTAWDADEPLPTDWETPKRCRSQIQAEYPEDTVSFEEWHGEPPDPAYYRHRRWTTEEATAYQVYETVSEGTPVSPVLKTREELIAWLTSDHPGWGAMSRAGAEAFAEDAWVPSGVASAIHGLESGIEHLDRTAREGGS
jgi:hypothetical protein